MHSIGMEKPGAGLAERASQARTEQSFGRGGRHGQPSEADRTRRCGDGFRSGPEFVAPPSGQRSRSWWAPPTYPWQWSAGVLAGLAAASVLVLATRVRGLDRLR